MKIQNWCKKKTLHFVPVASFDLKNFKIYLGVIHKLHWLHILAFFDHLLLCVDIFYGMNVDKKRTFLDHLPTSSCKRSLWTPPKVLVTLYNYMVSIQKMIFGKNYE